ncbi:hypothetical protein DSO57_1038480 [Entomophthora muscae]|uniref:Uncharacterized protein n=1 Tax=Entomophthora muscae TaxID=34485 RepID=A0ACC2T9V9_9FUNG|nr:hypothetical protein DSO57_1038480 [Entomophthora muscae]
MEEANVPSDKPTLVWKYRPGLAQPCCNVLECDNSNTVRKASNSWPSRTFYPLIHALIISPNKAEDMLDVPVMISKDRLQDRLTNETRDASKQNTFSKRKDCCIESLVTCTVYL